MPFQALTGAPTLRDGVTVNIMAYPQLAGSPPEPLTAGAYVILRFGHCCPTLSEGRIIDVEREPARITLALGDARWTLEPAATCVSVPGIQSQDWIVRVA